GKAGGAGGGGGSTSSFLTGPKSLFTPLWQLLLHNCRPAVRRQLVRQLAAFVLGAGGGTALAGVRQEVGVIVGNAASAAPREALRVLVLPLLAAVEAEVAELGAVEEEKEGKQEGGTVTGRPPPHPPSAGLESQLRYQLALLRDAVQQLHADVLLLPYIHTRLGQQGGRGRGEQPGHGRRHTPPQEQEQGQQGQQASEGDVSPPAPPPLPPGSLIARLVSLSGRLARVNSR
ncbi:hypothetical protein Agub_g5523, partial [Astrephomene gubernaculifera]